MCVCVCGCVCVCACVRACVRARARARAVIVCFEFGADPSFALIPCVTGTGAAAAGAFDVIDVSSFDLYLFNRTLHM